MRQETKPNQKKMVMALFPNAVGVGIAVLEDALTLIDAYMVVTKPRPLNNTQLLKRIKEKINYYKPELIILEDPKGFGSRKSKRVQRLIKAIEKHTVETSINVSKYSRADIRFVFSLFDAQSKYEIAKVIAENIPSIKDRLWKPRKTYQSDNYSVGIFDAVSLAITHFYKTD